MFIILGAVLRLFSNADAVAGESKLGLPQKVKPLGLLTPPPPPCKSEIHEKLSHFNILFLANGKILCIKINVSVTVKFRM